MTTCPSPQHSEHSHQHGPGCGHPAVRHDGHVDYLHTAAPRTIAAPATSRVMCMARVAAMRQCRTAIMSTTALAATCIIRMAIIATITGR